MTLRRVLSLIFIVISAAFGPILLAQTHQERSGAPAPLSSGINWAMQAMLALTGGNPVSSVTESGSVTRSI